ncbi:hypothetical protein CLHUN_30000 [Ruminiclostridium hungatei]|uniref:Uncharacterized protein n=1 Tax=Ruminiclostridium hungatei TaxID=48256 RepID=A0A1V4SGR9_RUMHU|nr:hypothetical protein CLHUN_30000 [Ruminiclostridium hungatei]
MYCESSVDVPEWVIFNILFENQSPILIIGARTNTKQRPIELCFSANHTTKICPIYYIFMLRFAIMLGKKYFTISFASISKTAASF